MTTKRGCGARSMVSRVSTRALLLAGAVGTTGGAWAQEAQQSPTQFPV